MDKIKKLFSKKLNNSRMERMSLNWICETHNAETIKSWNNQLKYGYFKRMWGGFADDGDEFGIRLNFKDKSELKSILNLLGIELKETPKDNPKPIKGKEYTSTDFKKFKNEIIEYPEFEQPGHTYINNVKCFCWISNYKIRLSFSGAKDDNLYVVSELDFQNCLKIEKLIEKENITKYIDTDFSESSTIISKQKYPELF